ncbi:helix-turn-helix domain-containing protein [Streptococcus iniae]|uniref:helix-turn-helix domain-containing protein n=1 Tax=Streptococcus iniae TaxID=1346 RepID=UPI000EF6B84F|nr:helix-turn-helix domain-containing protein [Streptococcus iniae]RLV18964.1 XRE family transcriptional regulator [Streptococcus iniae]
MKATTSQRLNQLMSERNLRQVDILNLSQKYQKDLDIKIGKSALSQYISGKSVPDQNKLVLLGKTLNVSEPWLMGYDVPKERNDNMFENNKETIDLKDVLNRTVAFDGHTLDENDAELIKSLLENMVKNKD